MTHRTTDPTDTEVQSFLDELNALQAKHEIYLRHHAGIEGDGRIEVQWEPSAMDLAYGSVQTTDLDPAWLLEWKAKVRAEFEADRLRRVNEREAMLAKMTPEERAEWRANHRGLVAKDVLEMASKFIPDMMRDLGES